MNDVRLKDSTANIVKCLLNKAWCIHEEDYIVEKQTN